MNKTSKRIISQKLVLRKEAILLLTGIQLSKVRGGEISGGAETCGPTITGLYTCTNS